MNEGDYATSTRYSKVCVLLLSWDSDFDDLRVQSEVEELGKVFKEIYHFDVESRTMRNDPNKRVQVLINKIVAIWVAEKDSPKTLFIVYYAGHGRPGPKEGDLVLTGTTRPHDHSRDHLDAVVWNRTEGILQDAHADVLQIFDCCYAGNLGPIRGGTRAFEYLGASSSDLTTKGPGEKSFTTALIWALKETRSARFTTLDLLNKVCEAPNFPESQKPNHQRRNNNNSELIILEPFSDDEPSLSPDLVAHKDSSGKEILTLKFVLETRPSAQDVEAFGRDLNSIASKKDHLLINRIMWCSLQARHSEAVFEAATRFLKPLRQRQPFKAEQPQRPEDAAIVEMVHQMEDTMTASIRRRFLTSSDVEPDSEVPAT